MKRRPIEERFWPKVARGGDCWEWTGSLYPSGYGSIREGGRTGPVKAAHRVSWEIRHGPIPAGKWVLHRCDNRKCVRPEHLFLGTRADNIADMVAKGRQRRGPNLKHRGELQWRARLTAEVVAAIRADSARGLSFYAIGKQRGLGHGHVWKIVRRHIWAHVP